MLGRPLLSVFTGYVATAFMVFVIFTAAYLILGADGAFVDGSWEVSVVWVALSILVELGATFVGGWICRKIAGRASGPLFLVAVILVLGFAQVMVSGDPAAVEPRTVDPEWVDAMNKARQPLWILYLNPILGAVGVLLGSRQASRRPRDGGNRGFDNSGEDVGTF